MARLLIDTESNLLWFDNACQSFRNREELWTLIHNPHIIKAASETRPKPAASNAPRETIEEALARGLVIQRIAPSVSHAQRKAAEQERLASLSVDELLGELAFELGLAAEGEPDTAHIIPTNEELAA